MQQRTRRAKALGDLLVKAPEGALVSPAGPGAVPGKVLLLRPAAGSPLPPHLRLPSDGLKPINVYLNFFYHDRLDPKLVFLQEFC